MVQKIYVELSLEMYMLGSFEPKSVFRKFMSVEAIASKHQRTYFD